METTLYLISARYIPGGFTRNMTAQEFGHFSATDSDPTVLNEIIQSVTTIQIGDHVAYRTLVRSTVILPPFELFAAGGQFSTGIAVADDGRIHVTEYALHALLRPRKAACLFRLSTDTAQTAETLGDAILQTLRV